MSQELGVVQFQAKRGKPIPGRRYGMNSIDVRLVGQRCQLPEPSVV
jgi:hypothetical protein